MLLTARCVSLRLQARGFIFSRTKKTSTTAELAKKAGADLSSPRKIGLFPPTPAGELHLALDKAALRDPTVVQTIRCWNQQVCRAKVTFYHDPRSNASDQNLALLEAIHRNTKGHLAPLRFTLDVREGLPSADVFHEVLYHSGGTSLAELFVVPESQHRHYIPNVPALLELLSKDPLLLNVPLVLYAETEEIEESFFCGPNAVGTLLKLMETSRNKQLGPAKSTILNRLAATGDQKSINRPANRRKVAKVKGVRLDR
ncbi:hypothetical protein C8R45DRAFT_338530 [Mycena sanguinolenta]|nr:hypothetical protein C8R45DRAFT_338530 [Mycena sanguinolenta]